MTTQFIRLTSAATGHVHLFRVDSIEHCSPVEKCEWAVEGEPGHADYPARTIVETARGTLHARETIEEIAVKLGDLNIEVV